MYMGFGFEFSKHDRLGALNEKQNPPEDLLPGDLLRLEMILDEWMRRNRQGSTTVWKEMETSRDCVAISARLICSAQATTVAGIPPSSPVWRGSRFLIWQKSAGRTSAADFGRVIAPLSCNSAATN